MTTTPGPWEAIEYTPPTSPVLRPLYPEGTWLVVGPESDRGERHTVCAVMPCGALDGTEVHPGRARHDAKLIAALNNYERVQW